MNAIDQLCPNCGMCCDGTLFADVELRAGDDPKRLKKLGLPIDKKGRTKLAFPQSCDCFDGKLCRIYTDRPKRCRQFVCGLLKQVKANQMEATAALEKIRTTRKQYDKVNQLLIAMGQTDFSVALTHRYADGMHAPLDLANEENADHYGQLMAEMDHLMQLLQLDFLS